MGEPYGRIACLPTGLMQYGYMNIDIVELKCYWGGGVNQGKDE